MKNIILPFVLLFSIYGFSQSKIDITKEGLINTTQVIALDSLNAKEIYSRINKYIQKNYTNPDKVSKGNIENEFVSFNGIDKSAYYNLEYYFNIDIKDKKIKIEISKMNEVVLRSNSDNVNINLLAPNSFIYFNKDGSLRDRNIEHKKVIEKKINDIVENFVSSIKESKKSDW